MPKFAGIASLIVLVISVGAFQQAVPPSPAPTFYQDVLPILQDHCQSCHRPGQIAPMPLVTYAQARAKAMSIAQMVRMKKMPPWLADPKYSHFSNDPSLTPEQIETIIQWVDAGAPAGQTRDAPPAKQWIEGWNIS